MIARPVTRMEAAKGWSNAVVSRAIGEETGCSQAASMARLRLSPAFASLHRLACRLISRGCDGETKRKILIAHVRRKAPGAFRPAEPVERPGE